MAQQQRLARRQRRGALGLAALGLAVSLWSRLGLASRGFAAPGPLGRREAVLLSLSPLAAASITAAAPALAEGALGFSLEGPAGPEWVKSESQGSTTFRREKDGASITAGPGSKGYVKRVANEVAAPTLAGPPGIDMRVYKLSAAQDDLEYVELLQHPPQSVSSPFYQYFGGRGRSVTATLAHKWARSVKKDGKEALIEISLPEGSWAAEKDAIEKVLNSFKIA